MGNRAEREELFKRLLLEMAQVRSVEPLLRLIVTRLVERPHVALARIWLMAPGDICDRCAMASECTDRSLCLHLAASAGKPVAEKGADWSKTDGFFCRFPLGVRKVGRVAATGDPVEVADIEEDSRWIARPEWAKSEGVRGFGGQPLIHRGDVLGVMGVFTRNRLAHEAFVWQRMIADHAAGAIANARAFEEIERLRRQLELENTFLRADVDEALAYGDLVGKSPALRRVREQIDLVAPTDASVLVLGESGTGKELVAREIHKRSGRADRPLIKVNCAAVPKDLYESEFFGHKKGAFTGAVQDREGRFQAADGGTLFLDEVGEIPLELQGKLLRVLQEGQFERVGEEKTRAVDVRIVAATNKDLKREVETGAFRQDLYYRLNVFPIEVAPLREHPEDIRHLVTRFLERLAPKARVSQAAVGQLEAYAWPGNVRELRNVLERAVITARGGRLRFDLPVGEARSVPPRSRRKRDDDVLTDAELRERERANLQRALARTGWKVSGPDGTAELLGVKPTTLASRMKKLGLRRPQ